MAKPKKKDLDSAVQTSLGLADTALQSETDPVWSSEKASYVPYTGATAQLDMGTYGMTTSGLIDLTGGTFVDVIDVNTGNITGIYALKNSNGVEALNLDAYSAYASGYSSIDWNNRKLFASDGSTVNAVWNSTTRGLEGGSDGGGGWYYSLNLNDATLNDPSGVGLNWSSRYLQDSGGYTALSWANRYLSNSSGNAVLDWSGAYSPNINLPIVNGSYASLLFNNGSAYIDYSSGDNNLSIGNATQIIMNSYPHATYGLGVGSGSYGSYSSAIHLDSSGIGYFGIILINETSPYDNSCNFEVYGKGGFQNGTSFAYFADGLNNYAGYFAKNSSTTYIMGSDGSCINFDVPGWWGGVLGGSGGAGYFHDNARTVYLADSNYAVNASGLSRFSDGTNTVYMTDTALAINASGTIYSVHSAGNIGQLGHPSYGVVGNKGSGGTAGAYFDDGTTTVTLSNGTYSINATGDMQVVSGTYTMSITSAGATMTDGVLYGGLAVSGYGVAGTRASGGGTAGGYFDDGGASSIVYIADGTYAINATGNSLFTGNITATSFITSGGLSSQFVKGDGSLDSNTYLTTGAYTGDLKDSTSTKIADVVDGLITAVYY